MDLQKAIFAHKMDLSFLIQADWILGFKPSVRYLHISYRTQVFCSYLLIEPHSMWMGFQLFGVSSPRGVSRVLSMMNEIPKAWHECEMWLASKFMLFFVFVLWAWIPTTVTCEFISWHQRHQHHHMTTFASPHSWKHNAMWLWISSQ